VYQVKWRRRDVSWRRGRYYSRRGRDYAQHVGRTGVTKRSCTVHAGPCEKKGEKGKEISSDRKTGGCGLGTRAWYLTKRERSEASPKENSNSERRTIAGQGETSAERGKEKRNYLGAEGWSRLARRHSTREDQSRTWDRGVRERKEKERESYKLN